MVVNMFKSIGLISLFSLLVSTAPALKADDGVTSLFTISGTGGGTSTTVPFASDIRVSTAIVTVRRLDTKFCSLSFRVTNNDFSERDLLFDWTVRDDDKRENLTEKTKQFDFGEGITVFAGERLSMMTDNCAAAVYFYWKDVE